jgi:hypothetical protein
MSHDNIEGNRSPKLTNLVHDAVIAIVKASDPCMTDVDDELRDLVEEATRFIEDADKAQESSEREHQTVAGLIAGHGPDHTYFEQEGARFLQENPVISTSTARALSFTV